MSKPFVWAVISVAAFFASGCSMIHADQRRMTPVAQKTAIAQYWSRAGIANKEAYDTVDAIQVESSDKRMLTDAQIATLNKYVGSPDILVRLDVLVALRHAGISQSQSAAAVARKGFISPDSMTRMYALTTLDSLNAPDVVPVAKKMLSVDPSQFVKGEAEKILKKRGVVCMH